MTSFLNSHIVEDDFMSKDMLIKIYKSQTSSASPGCRKNWIYNCKDFVGIESYARAKYCSANSAYIDLTCKNKNSLPTLFVGPLPVVGLRCSLSDASKIYRDDREGQTLSDLGMQHRVFILTSMISKWPAHSYSLIQKRLESAQKAYIAWLDESPTNVQNAAAFLTLPVTNYKKVINQQLNPQWIQFARKHLIAEALRQQKSLMDYTYVDADNVERQGLTKIQLPIDRKAGKIRTEISQLIRVPDGKKRHIKLVGGSAEDIRNTSFHAYLELDDSIFRICSKTFKVHLQVKTIIFHKGLRETQLVRCILSTTDAASDEDEGSQQQQQQAQSDNDDGGMYKVDNDDEDPPLSDVDDKELAIEKNSCEKDDDEEKRCEQELTDEENEYISKRNDRKRNNNLREQEEHRSSSRGRGGKSRRADHEQQEEKEDRSLSRERKRADREQEEEDRSLSRERGGGAKGRRTNENGRKNRKS